MRTLCLAEIVPFPLFTMQLYSITAADKGQRLDKYIKRRLPDAPASFIYKMLRKKNIVLNGKKAAGSEILAMGDEVRFFLSDETIAVFGGKVHTSLPDQVFASSKESVDLPKRTDHLTGQMLDARQASRQLQRQYPDLKILYEDADIAAAFKPAGLLSQKASEKDHSLNEWFLGTLIERGEVTEDSLVLFTPSVQNRLDRGTEGIVLLSKTLYGSHLLTALQRDRTLHKYYIAILCGRVSEGGIIEGWLRKDSGSNTVRLVKEQVPGAVWSETDYHPVAYSRDGQLTGVEAELITGRSHQLRVHFASIGHPVLGDPKYGNPSFNLSARKQGITRQLLLCQRVEFPPLEGEYERYSSLKIEVSLPEEYLNTMKGR